MIEPPREEDMAKKAAPKLGAIEGTVVEGDRPQAGLKVYLIDPMPPPNKSPYLSQKATDEKGAFSFKDLEPKRYRLYCVKQGSDGQRVADQQVTVDSGQTLKVTLAARRSDPTDSPHLRCRSNWRDDRPCLRQAFGSWAPDFQNVRAASGAAAGDTPMCR